MNNTKRVRTNLAVDGSIDTPGIAPRSVTSADAAETTDSILLLSGASFTLDLYTAVGNAGRRLTIKHAGNNVTQAYTIDPDGSETINGQSTYILHTNGEVVEIVSDGSNWIIVRHDAKTPWIAFTGTSTWNTGITSNSGFWRRNGDTIEVEQTILCSGAPTATSLIHTLPLSLVMDTAKLSNSSIYQNMLGAGLATDVAVNGYPLECAYETNTTVQIFSRDASGTYVVFGSVNDTSPFTFGATDTVQTKYSAPIVGWEA